MGQAMQKQAAKSEFVELKQSQTILFPGAKPEHKERSKTSRQRRMSRRRIQISSTEDESENASEGEEDKHSEANDAAARKTKKPGDDDHIYANAAQPKRVERHTRQRRRRRPPITIEISTTDEEAGEELPAAQRTK